MPLEMASLSLLATSDIVHLLTKEVFRKLMQAEVGDLYMYLCMDPQ